MDVFADTYCTQKENGKTGEKKKKSKNLSETGSGAELGETDEYQLDSKKMINIRYFFF